ncbi:MAG: VWA domain-containing protein [Actinomycetia bacterium]|nr:VWA domain-containing protein [Actinomycetes bacterium]MCP4959163.1 VWA domain-containing protein [Actinomycetes bacterium]
MTDSIHTGFKASVFQNEYLPAGGTSVDAIITVASSHEMSRNEPVGGRVEVIVIDTSGSMKGDNGAKIAAARLATIAAVNVLADGTEFAVVMGNHEARMLYPHQGLAVASGQTRSEACDSVRRVQADGGTAIGAWLLAASALFNLSPGGVAHCTLLTDGKNEHEKPWQLDQAIAHSVGRFQCDARGLGTDWDVTELRKISAALLGTVDIVPSPHELEDEFRALTMASMSKQIGSVALRLWTPKGSTLGFLKQVSPNLEDLSDKGSSISPLIADYPLGAWGADEERDYHLRIDVPVGTVGQERLAARVMLTIDGEEQPAALVRAVWTDDDVLTTRINGEVAHYTGQAELADAIADGLAAREEGDGATATIKLGRAVQLAHEAGNDDTVRLLSKVVEVDDPKTGTVRLRRRVEAADAMALDVRSTRTVRVNRRPSSGDST